MLRRIVIVGASAAGLSAAEALRNKGYDGGLTLLGDEPHLPYDRPPLSKQILSGAWEPQQVRLRDEHALRKLDADLLLGRTAVGRGLAAGRRVRFEGTVSSLVLTVAGGVYEVDVVPVTRGAILLVGSAGSGQRRAVSVCWFWWFR